MPTKNFQFFALPGEISQLLNALTMSEDLWFVVLENDRCRQVSLEELTAPSNEIFEHLFVATDPPNDDQLKMGEIAPAKYGWLQIDLPKQLGRQLFLADFAMKSDWYDEKAKNVVVNKQLAPVYRRLLSKLRDSLGSPVWACNIITGGKASYSDMGITRGAAQWEEEGGELRQFGVENVRFSARGK